MKTVLSPLGALAVLLVLSTQPVLAEDQQPFTLYPAPGTYSETTSVSITPSASDVSVSYAFDGPLDRVGQSEVRSVAYRGPIVLSALPGERRSYSLSVIASTAGKPPASAHFIYVIDRTAPLPPIASLPSGRYSAAQSVTFSASAGCSVVYSLDAPVGPNGTVWDGKPISLPVRSNPYRLEAFARGGAGTSSGVAVWSYDVAGAGEPAGALRVLSPVSGQFANPQELVVPAGGFAWIRYSTDGSDPSSSGAAYTGPVALDATGDVTLRVAALPIGAAAPLEADVRYSVGGGAVEATVTGASGQGIATGPLEIALPPGHSYHYSFRDQTPAEADLEYTQKIAVPAPAGAIEYLPFRYRELLQTGAWGAERRLFFVIDTRVPAEPAIRVVGGGSTLNASSQLTIRGSSFATLRYTLDGSDPAQGGIAYTGRFTPPLPPDSTGTLSVRAVATGPNGSTSDAAASFPYSTKLPDAPSVTATDAAQGAPANLALTSPDGTRLVYEMTADGSEPKAPGMLSPRIGASMSVSVPWGMSRSFQFRFAALDRFGNVSAPTKVVKVTVDRIPPPPPTITVTDGRLAIAGEGRLYFTVSDDGTPPLLPSALARRYVIPVPLATKNNALAVYRFAAVAVDDAGNVSDPAVAGPFYLDSRTPAVPPVYGIEAGGVYGAARTLQIAPDPVVVVHYTSSSDGTLPPDPDTSSPTLSAPLPFGAPDGESRHFIVKMLPESQGKVGSVQTLEFTIDRSKPAVPPPTGFIDQGATNLPVTVSDSAADADTTLFIGVSSSGTPPDPLGPDGEVFSASRLFDVPQGTSKSFSIRVGARDRAGNSAELDHVYTFTIDKSPPPPPRAVGLPTSGVTTGPVTIQLVGEDGKIFYRMSSDGSDVPPPDLNSTPYSAPITLEGAENRTTTYTISAIAQDQAGNVSAGALTLRVRIVRVVPPTPPPPSIVLSPGRAEMSWNESPGVSYLYAVTARGSSVPSPDGFAAYSGPVGFDVPDGQSAFTVWYFARDEVGNQSSVARLDQTALPKVAGSIIDGVADGALTNKAVTLTRLLDPRVGTVRYELASSARSDDSAAWPSPAQVSESSPLLPDRLAVDVPAGATVGFALRYAVFGDRTDLGVGGLIRFTIDRTPPPPPAISGVVDGGRYRDARSVTLTASTGTIYYSLSKNPAANSRPGQFVRYSGPITIGDDQTAFEIVRLVAYSVDEAGNQSVANAMATVYFDRGVIYVAPSGDDDAAGTSDAPLRTLSKALSAVSGSDKSVIALSVGNYAIDAPIEIRNDLQIVGGFDAANWAVVRNDKMTNLRPSALFPTGKPLFTIMKGTGRLANLAIADSHDAPESILVQGGSLTIEGGSLTLATRPAALLPAGPALALLQTSGELVLSDVSWTSGTAGRLIESRGGKIGISDSTFRGTATPSDATAITLQNVDQAVMRDSKIDPGAGRNTVGLRLVDSPAQLADCDLGAGAGSISAIALSMYAASATVSGGTISGNGDARLSFGIQAQESSVALSGTKMSVAGRTGALGVYADRSTVGLSGVTLRASPTGEFLYLVKLLASKGTFENSVFVGESTGDFVGLSLARSVASFIDNTLVGGSGRDRTAGLLLEDPQRLVAIDNVIVRTTASPAGSAITLAAASAGASASPFPVSQLQIIGNDFAGWQSFLSVGSGQYTSVDTLNGADGLPAGGSIASNLTENPLKSFAGPDDFHLRAGSVCIGGGVDARPFGGPAVDIEGNPRPLVGAPKARFDIGAYQFK